MTEDSAVRIRLASVEDEDFLISLVPRLTEFGPPAWRDAAQLTAFDAQVLSERLANPPKGTVIFIAEAGDGAALGFIHLRVGTDYYNHEEHGHVEDLIVAPEGEGRGVGRLLMEKGEEWARAQGYGWLTLSVFARNVRARNLYGRLGYGKDIIKYVKELD